MEPDPYVQFLENWIPGIGESTELHDQLHIHFDLGFEINDEARLLGFQLGHHPCWKFLSCNHLCFDEFDDLSKKLSKYLERC